MVTAASRGTTQVLLAAVLLLGFLVHPLASPARADTMFGHDISWPQCSRDEGGYGLPLPPESTDFVIVGLTHGLAFTENPCLADQVRWARDHGTPTQAYAMGTFPTSSQLSAHGDEGPWDSSTRTGQLSNVGYAAAEFAAASMERLDWRPPKVWIDVEPRRAQPWPTGSAAREQENRSVLKGLMRGLQDHGFTYGLYSYATGWREITGDWQLPDVPVWATVGRLNYPDEALDGCSRRSFSGGPVHVAQWYDDTRDYDRACSGFAF